MNLRNYKTVLNLDYLYGGLEFSKDVRPADKRIHWQIAELNELFKTPMWVGTSERIQKHRHKKGTKIIKDSYWWLPIIALFTGLRLEEICQLQASDLKTEANIDYLDISEGEDKRLKTPASKRLVPVHQTLKDLGFIKLFGNRKTTTRIFPELPAGGPEKKFGYDYTTDFTDYRRKTNTYEKLKDFHSFRHTFVSIMGNLTNHNMVLIRSIVGHSSESQTEDYTHVELPEKAKAIMIFTYVGLDISHLYPKT